MVTSTIPHEKKLNTFKSEIKHNLNGGSLKVNNLTTFIDLFMHDDVQQKNETGSIETHHNVIFDNGKPSSWIENGFVGLGSCSSI